MMPSALRQQSACNEISLHLQVRLANWARSEGGSAGLELRVSEGYTYCLNYLLVMQPLL